MTKFKLPIGLKVQQFLIRRKTTSWFKIFWNMNFAKSLSYDLFELQRRYEKYPFWSDFCMHICIYIQDLYGQKKTDKRANNHLRNIAHKTKDRVTWTRLKTACELGSPGRLSSSCSTSLCKCQVIDESGMKIDVKVNLFSLS
jgi:hypothetical protein